MQIIKGTKAVTSVEEWFLLAPPAQGAKHWVDGRSAKEMATEYLATAAADRIKVLLSPTFGQVELQTAEPECSVPFDSFSGPRKCDLAIQAMASIGKIVIHVEGKADESFGEYVGEVYDASNVKNAELNRKRFSNIPKRVELLADRIFGSGVDEHIRNLRYQLLFGVAAAMSDAVKSDAKAVVFLVHEFHSTKTTAEKVKRNKEDWEMFLRAFFGTDDSQAAELIGPAFLDFVEWKLIPLYFCKMLTRLPRTQLVSC